MSDSVDPVMDTSRMSLTEHLEELRTRIIHSLLGLLVAFGICYSQSEPLFQILLRPLIKVLPPGGTVAITNLAEGFMVHLRVGLIGGFFLASPWFFYQIWRFVAPGLYPKERALVVPLMAAASGLFLVGASFGYFVVFPYVFGFFVEEAGAHVMPVLSISDYLGFSAQMLAMFGLVFELPLASFIVSRLGIVTAAQMISFRRYAIVAIFVIAAVITPPDVVSQTFVALPLCILYEISIIVARVFGRESRWGAPAQASGEAEAEE